MRSVFTCTPSLFCLQIKQKLLSSYQDWKSKPPGSLTGFCLTPGALGQGTKQFRRRTALQHVPSLLGWGTPKHNTLQWGVHTPQQCTGHKWGAGTQGISCANAVRLLLPAQRWHLVSHPQKFCFVFNPLGTSLPFYKCHCTSSSISVSAGQEDQYGQQPQAQRVTHVTEHLTSSVPEVSF